LVQSLIIKHVKFSFEFGGLALLKREAIKVCPFAMKLGIEQAGPGSENRLEANLGQTFWRLLAAIDFFAAFAKGERQLPITTSEPQRGGSQGRAAVFLRRVHRSVAETLDGCRSGGYLRGSSTHW